LCPKHGEQSVSYTSLKADGGCPECRRESISGNGHPNWQGGITPLQKHMRKYITEWTYGELNRTNYVCEITTYNGILHVHHMYSFKNILNYTLDQLKLPLYNNVEDYGESISLLTSTFLENNKLLANPVVMLKEVHEAFHSFCGGNNKETSQEQLEEFKATYTYNKIA